MVQSLIKTPFYLPKMTCDIEKNCVVYKPEVKIGDENIEHEVKAAGAYWSYKWRLLGHLNL